MNIISPKVNVYGILEEFQVFEIFGCGVTVTGVSKISNVRLYDSFQKHVIVGIIPDREEFKGQMSRGNRTGPLRGKSASERVSEMEGFQRF